MDHLIKIAVVGPESTGKSTLAAYLATHYKTAWVPEYAREYCAALLVPPTIDDELNMFYGQLELEKRILPHAKGLLICDTTFLTVKIWSDVFFGHTPQPVLDELPRHPYDLYLLLNVDLPWQDDPLRDFPDQRDHFMQVWHNELKALNANYITINGSGEERNEQAIAAIDAFLDRTNILTA